MRDAVYASGNERFTTEAAEEHGGDGRLRRADGGLGEEGKKKELGRERGKV